MGVCLFRLINTNNNNNMKTVAQQFDECTLLKIFEIPVIDKRTGEEDYVIFNIEIRGNELVATHPPLSLRGEQSEKISFVSIEIDEDFDLNRNLDELYSECSQTLMQSAYFKARD